MEHPFYKKIVISIKTIDDAYFVIKKLQPINLIVFYKNVGFGTNPAKKME